jgi:hypothetical protein
MGKVTFRVHYITKQGVNGHIDIGAETDTPDLDAMRDRVRKVFPGCAIGKVKRLRGEEGPYSGPKAHTPPVKGAYRMPKSANV